MLETEGEYIIKQQQHKGMKKGSSQIGNIVLYNYLISFTNMQQNPKDGLSCGSTKFTEVFSLYPYT